LQQALQFIDRRRQRQSLHSIIIAERDGDGIKSVDRHYCNTDGRKTPLLEFSLL
jgi:hypothetical protein